MLPLTVLVLSALSAPVFGATHYNFEEWQTEILRHQRYRFTNVNKRSPQSDIPPEPEMIPEDRDPQNFPYHGGPSDHRGPPYDKQPPSYGDLPGHRGPPSNRGPPDHRGPPSNRGPPDHRGPPSNRGPPDHRGPPSNREPLDHRGPASNRGPSDQMGPSDYRGKPDNRTPVGPNRPGDYPYQDYRPGDGKKPPYNGMSRDLNKNTQITKDSPVNQNGIVDIYSDNSDMKIENTVGIQSHGGIPLVNNAILNSSTTKRPLQLALFQAIAVTPESD